MKPYKSLLKYFIISLILFIPFFLFTHSNVIACTDGSMCGPEGVCNGGSNGEGNCTFGGTECGGAGGRCPDGYTCVAGDCVAGGGGGGGGGLGCLGCYLDENGKGMYSIGSVSVAQTTSTTASVSWTPSTPSACNQGSVHIFVGRNYDVVNANCGWSGEYWEATTAPDVDIYYSSGGLGGGGKGGPAFYLYSPTNGAANTGGGGGGDGKSGTNGVGGSGIVIVRYPAGSVSATGGSISTVGSDTIHTFTSDGTFTVNSGSTSSARLLVVAGGGGGGINGGGGGAGGGVIYNDPYTLSPQSYAVTVGAGGTFNTMWSNRERDSEFGGWFCNYGGDGRGGTGGNSSFGGITANGGGGGGSNHLSCGTGRSGGLVCCYWANQGGASGGSGGGPDGYTGWPGPGSPGSGIPGQGNSGGNLTTGGGGGGGAGEAGHEDNGGDGGNGMETDISGTSQYYGGGGGGGSIPGSLPPGCYKYIKISGQSARSYTIDGLAPNTTYYVKVIPAGPPDKETWEVGPCGTVNAVSSSLCTASVNPSIASIPEGQTIELTTAVSGPAGNPTVKYTQGGSPPFFSFTPSETSDATSLYRTTIQALRRTVGSQPATANVYLNPDDAVPACVGVSNIAVTAPVDPWWQVEDSDIQANGDLTSLVPGSLFFGLDGAGGFPGVAAYSGQTNITGSNVSSKGWLANTASKSSKVFNYDYFANQIPDDLTPTAVDSGNLVDQITSSGSEQYGYYWYKYDGGGLGDLALGSPLDIGSKKVILLVDNANFNINSGINLTDNQGFFMVIVKGNIIVDPAVGGGGPNLEGLYVADNQFKTGIAATQLWVRGSVVGYAGVQLERDLGPALNGNTPSEFFEYAPDQIMLFPAKLGVRKINWKEVAP